MTKKKSRKAARVADRTEQFIERFKQYDDFAGFDLENLPSSLPRTFTLKIGPDPIGSVTIDWNRVRDKVFALAAALSKPDNVTFEEYAEQLDRELASLRSHSPKEAAQIFTPLLGTVIHMAEHMPQKLKDAAKNLFLEGRESVIILLEQQQGSKNTSPAKFAKYIAELERAATRARLPEIRGGDQKTKADWKSPDTLKEFAQRVDDRKPLVRQIKYVFSECLEDDTWISDLKADRPYLALSQGVPAKVLDWAIKRIADDNAKDSEREPQAVACEMARQELDLEIIESTTQQEKYRAGKDLIKEAKSRPSPPRAS